MSKNPQFPPALSSPDLVSLLGPCRNDSGCRSPQHAANNQHVKIETSPAPAPGITFEGFFFIFFFPFKVKSLSVPSDSAPAQPLCRSKVKPRLGAGGRDAASPWDAVWHFFGGEKNLWSKARGCLGLRRTLNRGLQPCGDVPAMHTGVISAVPHNRCSLCALLPASRGCCWSFRGR